MGIVSRWLLAIAAAALFTFALRSALLDESLGTFRLAVILVGLTGSALSLRSGTIAVLVVAPLGPVVSRVLLETPGLSLAEHLLVGVLLAGSLGELRRHQIGTRTRIDWPLLCFVLVVVASATRILFAFNAGGFGPWQVVADPLINHFSHRLGDFAHDRFLVVHHSLVIIEGALWFHLLTRPTAKEFGKRYLVPALMWPAFIVVLVGLAQTIWRFAPLSFFQECRVSSTLADPNTLGAYLALVIPLGIAFSFESRRPWARLILWLGLAGYCLMVTFSRSSWVGLGVALVAALVLLLRKQHLFALHLGSRAKSIVTGVAVGSFGVFICCVVLATYSNASRDILSSGMPATGPCSPYERVLVSIDLRRPMDEILAGRLTIWKTAVDFRPETPAATIVHEKAPGDIAANSAIEPTGQATDRSIGLGTASDAPGATPLLSGYGNTIRRALLGVGIGRYPTWNLRPDDGIVDSGPGQSGKSVSTLGPGRFERWLNGSSLTDFKESNVLPGDTIESSAGGWGPLRIAGRFDSDTLIVVSPVPRGSELDYVIRHPELPVTLRAHAHTSDIPFFVPWSDAHNQYIKIITELGLLGLGVFSWLLFELGQLTLGTGAHHSPTG
ncbi:MAG: hypothetical protein VCA74_05710, partial [Deltaproteobacteria bacterium]